MRSILITILIFVFSCHLSAQKIQFKRVCRNGTSNNLLWQVNPDSCFLYSSIKLIGTESPVFPFYQIDSGINPAIKQYTHLAANIPSKKDWIYFLQYQVICGSDTLTVNSDTLSVDTSRAEPTYLDSVSVDPISNVVYIGWTSNKSPDFSSYYLYNSEKADPRLAENYTDTFYIQTTPPLNPKSAVLSYDIASADSCDNRQVYGTNTHKTMWLTAKIDTCKNDVTINWTPYVGWTSIAKQYLYRNINSSSYLLLDSIDPSQNIYIDKATPNNSNLSYFIRAIKFDPNRFISSSSNSAQVSSGKSIQPTNTAINYVTNNNSSNLEIEIIPNPLSNYSAIDLFRYSGNQSPAKIYSFSLGETLYQDQNASNTTINKYFVVSKNTCGLYADSSANSNNIVLKLADNEGLVTLNWNKYFTWNDGVKEYIIFSASGYKLSDITNFTAVKSSGPDTFSSDASVSDKVVCYYIQAIENNYSALSKSNIACNLKIGQIFYPNAIVPDGINKQFTFKGLGIELDKSSIQIYNRWGVLVYEKQNINEPWYGTSNDNVPLEANVYLFIAKVFQGGEIITINGNITIIR